jgi:hypothetical protein
MALIERGLWRIIQNLVIIDVCARKHKPGFVLCAFKAGIMFPDSRELFLGNFFF